MNCPSRGAAVLTFLRACGAVHGQTATFFPLESVQAGQKGYARTVFEGSKIEEFELEILGVLKNVGPKQDMILARLLGERLTQPPAVAGGGAPAPPRSLVRIPRDPAGLAPSPVGVQADSSAWAAALRPIATPLNLGGFSTKAIEQFW